MFGWLIEAHCQIVHGHCWDRSRISTDLCMYCGKDSLRLRTGRRGAMGAAFQAAI